MVANKQDLQPGDLIFFGSSVHALTHVAMFVGGSNPSQNVVEAYDTNVGIIYSNLDQRVDNNDQFQGFGRVKYSQPLLLVKSHSPVSLTVTDPDGNTVSSSTYVFTGEEYIRGVPGELYSATDDEGDDVVYSDKLKSGTYSIQVTPKAGAGPNDTFGLDITGAAHFIDLATDTTISQIPANGYHIEVSDVTVNPGVLRVYLPMIQDNTSSSQSKPGTSPTPLPRRSPRRP